MAKKIADKDKIVIERSTKLAQYCTLYLPQEISELTGLPYNKAAEKIGKVIKLKVEAWPVYLAVGKALKVQYEKIAKDDYGSTPEEKAKGVSGNDAIHATLNECGIFYKTDQLFASYKSDRVWHDFILWPSLAKVEVKTSNSNYLNLNRNHWQGTSAPDVVISLKHSIRKGHILLEFKGWLSASEIKDRELELVEKTNPRSSYFKCPSHKLNPPVDIRKFLTGLANDGKKYLEALKQNGKVV